MSWASGARCAAVCALALFATSVCSPLSARETAPESTGDSVVLPAQGTVEVAFAPWDDPQSAIIRAVDGAKREIYVQAFLFTSRALAFSLQSAKQRGVKVEVLADAGMNKRVNNGSQIGLLAGAGIPVAIETDYSSAHNKVIVIDPEEEHGAVITGSYNFTWSARNRNAENLLILRGNRKLARLYLDNWRRHKERATPYAQFIKSER